MSLAAWALLNLQDAKAHLDVQGNADDVLVEALIEAATLACEAETGRKLKSRTYTDEKYNGSGSPNLRLREYPVTAVTAVSELTTDAPETWTAVDLTAHPVVIVEPVSEVIRYRDYAFPAGVQNVKVTYTAGLSTIEKNLREACKIALMALWKQKDKQAAGIVGQRLPDGTSVSFDTDALPRLFYKLLEPYKRWA